MKKITIISKEFYPVSNGTVNCLQNILEYLKDRLDITVVTCMQEMGTLQEENRFHVHIKRFSHPTDYAIIWKRKLLQRFQGRIGTSLIKILFRPFQLCSNRNGFIEHKSWAGNLTRAIDKEEFFQQSDVLVAVSEPYENVEAAVSLKVKYPDKQLILIMFDPFSMNPVTMMTDLSSAQREDRIQREYQWYHNADRIFVAREMYDKLLCSRLKDFSDRIIPFTIPSLRIKNVKDTSEDNKDGIHIVYIGSLYEDIRNPKFTLEIFSDILLQNPNIYLDFYGSGCESILCEYQRKIGEHFVIHGSVKKEEVIQITENANILLNIGNSTSMQLPSKILEYIGFGKPIINVFSIEDDTSNLCLEKYPIKICLMENYDNIEDASKLLTDFIVSNKDSRCDEEIIRRDYKEFMPEYFADTLFEEIEKL